MKRLFSLLKKTFLILFVLQLAYIVALKWINPPITITQITSLIDGYGLHRDYISYQAMPANVKLATIASEDQKFATHQGFDWDAIKEAQKSNFEGKRLRGGSTISQQVAKNVFLWQGRSWIRKGLEVYFTFMIEKIWGKQRILQMYLNVSETGIGTFGIEAAAHRYFNKSVAQLTTNEAARIIVNLPNPKKYSVNPPSLYVRKRAQWVETQIKNLKGNPQIREVIQ